MPESKEIVKVLLDEAERVSRRVYRSSFAFLILGLLVASVGVSYFYFSNDALVLDRAFYEEQVARLEADKAKLIDNNVLIATAYNKEIRLDSNNVRNLSSALGFGGRMYNAYVNQYNDMIDLASAKNDKELKPLYEKLIQHRKQIDLYKKQYSKLPSGPFGSTKADNEVIDIVKKYTLSVNSPVKVPEIKSSYDKPELIFSPKLVYGFFSRLGGLIFIELIAFYLLKQYRVNMNDFKYYNNLVTQARSNLYLVTMVDKLDDNKEKITIISKIFVPSIDSSTVPDQEDSAIPFSTSDLETLKKIVDLVKK